MIACQVGDVQAVAMFSLVHVASSVASIMVPWFASNLRFLQQIGEISFILVLGLQGFQS